jgi:predicted transglutaminase-like cysteine proteinase
MNQKQQAAKTAINQLSIELIALVNQQAPLTERELSKIRDISNDINYEINDLRDWEAFEKLFDIAS